MNTLPIAESRDALGTLHAFWQLTKPGVTRLVMVTMLCGALLAPARIEWVRLCVALFSTALVVAGANALNMYLERESDRAMERTRGRPLPSGRLAPEAAFWFGMMVGGVGYAGLGMAVNPTAALLAAVALLSYVLVYTPLKRITPLALYAGAVPGALPPVIGWASVHEHLTVEAWLLFAILFVWQLPHFLAIAVFRQREYERAGLVVHPSVRGLRATKHQIVLTSVLLVAVSLLPALLGFAGLAYLGVATVSGAVFLGWAIAGLRQAAGPRWARSLFFASMPYLVVVLGALVLERRLF